MTLRVEDLKPGDVVRIELEVTDADEWVAMLALVDGDLVRVDDACLAAGNAERVQRPRPVRKGDEVLILGSPGVFFAYAPDEEWPVIGRYETDTGPDGYNPEHVTHANGDPIDWEASE